MGRVLVIFSLLASLCAGCAPCCRDTTLYQRSGRQKAIVAVLPVINHAQSNDLAWDLSQEFTDEIRNRVFESQKIYLLREHSSREIAEKLNTPNLAMIPASLTKDLGAAEFIVVAELIDQKEVPLTKPSGRPGDSGSILNIAMRVRVLDVRHDKVKVILQEVINKEQPIARYYMNDDYAKTPWGTEAFHMTPLGIVHNKIVRELVARVENYIEAAR